MNPAAAVPPRTIPQTFAPLAVLFVCNRNAVRSPMAAALTRLLPGPRPRAELAGLQPGPPDPLMAAAMAELGLDLSGHGPRGLDGLGPDLFDLVVALSPEAQQRMPGWAAATPVEYWPTPDPTAVEGNHEQRLAAYRAARDGLRRRLHARFTPAPGADT